MCDVDVELITQLLTKFVSGMQPQGSKDTLCTVLSLYCGRWPISRNPEVEAGVDNSLLRSLAKIASPSEACAFIWTALGMEMPVDAFMSLFARCLSESSDLAIIYNVLGATVDFCRLRQVDILIPATPVERLLRSEDIDHQVVGMKAMLKTTIILESQLRHLLQGLEQPKCYVRAGALHVLLELLDVNRDVSRSSIFGDLRARISTRLDEISTGVECPELVSSANAARADPFFALG